MIEGCLVLDDLHSHRSICSRVRGAFNDLPECTLTKDTLHSVPAQDGPCGILLLVVPLVLRCARV